MPYKVLVGLSYPPDRRAEAGDIVDDLPSKSVKWLLEKGHIENVSGAAAQKPAPKPEPVADPEPEDGE